MVLGGLLWDGALTTATPVAHLTQLFLHPCLTPPPASLALAAQEHLPNRLPRPYPSMTLLSIDSRPRCFVETVLVDKQRERG